MGKNEIQAAQNPHGYSGVVDAILRLGDPREKGFDYRAMGITEADIPELLRAVRDPAFATYVEGDVYEWAGVHPLLALDSLPRIPVDAAKTLIGLLPRIDDEDDEWLQNHGPDVIAKAGEEIIPPLLAYFFDPTVFGASAEVEEENSDGRLYSRVTALDAICKIGQVFPESRGRCVRELASILARHASQDSTLNGFIVGDLIDLKAVEAIDVITEAFESENVDLGVAGDLEDVRIALGLQKKRATPKPRYNPLRLDDEEEFDGDEFDDDEFYGEPLEPIRREAPKVGRNEPCPCGSGKKHKKCCGK